MHNKEEEEKEFVSGWQTSVPARLLLCEGAVLSIKVTPFVRGIDYKVRILMG